MRRRIREVSRAIRQSAKPVAVQSGRAAGIEGGEHRPEIRKRNLHLVGAIGERRPRDDILEVELYVAAGFHDSVIAQAEKLHPVFAPAERLSR